MKVARSIVELRAALEPERRAGRVIGFVPTMGALHEGHLSLARIARSRADAVVLSIFVNPLQFGPSEDLEAYPRHEDADLEQAEAAGVDVAFLPSMDEMYPADATTRVAVGAIGDILEGEHRPGHFEGVATVVAKLFNAVAPDLAVFGQKDAQQVAVIRRMVDDLDFDVEIVVGETVRDADGLALSSRNAYLSSEERIGATALFRALAEGSEALRAGEAPATVETRMLELLLGESLHVDYAAVVDPVSFGEPAGDAVLLLIAARVGTTRLIDNMLVKDLNTGPVSGL